MTGYRGRFSIIEVLTVTPEVERRIAAGEPAEQIAVAARRGGMKSLWDSGLGHVLKGESTVDELMRVVDVPQEDVPEPVPAQASRRPPGGVPGSRIPAEPPAAFAAPTAATAEPLAHFDLLEEGPRLRVSGPHGVPAVKVLLVDDEDSLRKVMRDLLERDGYDVSEARDGVQALDQIDRVGPDIIVLDLNLPGLDGYGVLSHLRSRPATASIRGRGDEPWNRYPPFPPTELLERLAARHAWVASGVLVGNGSNELIQATLAVTVGEGTAVVTPTPTFSLYRLLAAVYGGRHVPLALTAAFPFDVDAPVRP